MTLSSAKGQAIIEYILILTVVVGLALGVLAKVNKAFNTWGQSMFGPENSYFACLLQWGSLPGLNPECTASYSALSEEITSSAKGGGGGGMSSPPNTKNPTTSNKKSSAARSGGRSSRPSSGSRSAGSPSSGRSFRRSSSPSGALMPISSSASSKRKTAKKTSSSPEGNLLKLRNNQSPKTSSSTSRGRRRGGIYSSGRFVSNQEEEKKETGQAGFTKTKADSQARSKSQKKVLFVAPTKLKTKMDTGDDQPWSFGFMFRIFLLICVLGAILFIVGSQLFQIKENMR